MHWLCNRHLVCNCFTFKYCALFFTIYFLLGVGRNLRLGNIWHCLKHGGTDYNNYGSLFVQSVVMQQPRTLGLRWCAIQYQIYEAFFCLNGTFTPGVHLVAVIEIWKYCTLLFVLNVELVTILCMEGIFLVLYECTLTECLLSVEFIKC